MRSLKTTVLAGLATIALTTGAYAQTAAGSAAANAANANTCFFIGILLSA